MRRRSRAAGEPVPKRRRKAATPRRGNAPKAVHRRDSSAAGRGTKVVRLARELQELLDREAATSEVLRIISSSPGDPRPAFEAILGSATYLCEAEFGILLSYDGKLFHTAATRNAPPSFLKFLEERGAFLPPPGTTLDQLLKTQALVHRADELIERAPGSPGRLAGAKSLLAVPMFKDNTLVGAIIIYRLEVRPFTGKQIELVKNFAAQAVIAIENTRLLNELRLRMDELSESLDQQTATSEVLRVISSSPGELQPVFDAILENAVQICEARFGILTLFDGIHQMRHAASYNVPPAFQELRRHEPVVPLKQTVAGRVVETRGVVNFADVAAEEGHADSALVKLAGARSAVGVPMLKDGELIGAIVIYRTEVRPFSDKQVKLLKDFAAQAVIAIENTRLLNELRQRTDDLSEALEQQTATSEVLQVISSSPGHLEPVFNAMLANATQLCGASYGVMFLCEGDDFRTVAIHGPLSEAFLKQWERGTLFRPDPELPAFRAVKTRQVMQVADLRTTPAYRRGDPLPVSAADVAGIRSMLTVPMLKNDVPIGVIAIYRKEVRSFTEKQVALVTNFAAQAVIAIENTRLLNELRQRTSDLSESLEQQTATSEVLRVISSSPGDLEPVFRIMLQNAARICEATAGNIYRWADSGLRLVASHNTPDVFAEFLRRAPVRATANNPVGRMLMTKSLIHTADLTVQQAYIEKSDPAIVAAVDMGRVRTQVSVPLLKESEFIGAITLWRDEVRPFADKQIGLLQSFAAQAVIAIENARLLSELKQSLEQQTATSKVLEVISGSPGELAPVFQTILQNATRLCDANFGTLTQVVDGVPKLMFQLGVPVALEQFWVRELPQPSAHNAISRVITSGQAVHVTDLQNYEAYRDGDPLAVAGVELGGIRTLLVVPMLKDEKTFGTIGIYRQEVRPFTDNQIELVSNFAAQAAIAIENARLLNELRRRTNDLSEALEQQTATAEVLRVISSSSGALEPVFEAMLKNATTICGARFR